MSDMKFLSSILWILGIIGAVVGFGLGSIPMYIIGLFLIVLPGFLVVPKHIYLHLTIDDVARLETVVEDYMSGLAELEDVEKAVATILEKHGYTKN